MEEDIRLFIKHDVEAQPVDSADEDLEGACPDCGWIHEGQRTFPHR